LSCLLLQWTIPFGIYSDTLTAFFKNKYGQKPMKLVMQAVKEARQELNQRQQQ
jgi:hypothetical protein